MIKSTEIEDEGWAKRSVPADRNFRLAALGDQLAFSPIYREIGSPFN